MAENYLTPEEVSLKIDELSGILPHSIIDELKAKLSNVKVSARQLEEILRRVLAEYYRSIIDPGEAIGIVTAQSVGEPSTQMILRTFHHAGLREFSMALGLPRLIEIIDARRKPKVPMMTIYLKPEYSKDEAKVSEIAARKIQMVTIENLAVEYSIDYFSSSVIIKISKAELEYRGLSINDVRKALERIKGRSGEVNINEVEDGYEVTISFETQEISKLKRISEKVLQTKVSGIRGIRKAQVEKIRNEKGEEEYIIRTEGTNLEAVLLLDEVDPSRTTSHDIHEVAEVLGIEAARSMIIDELKSVLERQGLDVDVRHLMLVADVMTWSGRGRQIGRHGVAGQKTSPLARAAFEVTVKNLVEAAYRGETERFRGVVESIIAGKYIPVGTGYVELMIEHP